jgi:hypothetical protein
MHAGSVAEESFPSAGAGAMSDSLNPAQPFHQLGMGVSSPTFCSQPFAKAGASDISLVSRANHLPARVPGSRGSDANLGDAAGAMVAGGWTREGVARFAVEVQAARDEVK